MFNRYARIGIEDGQLVITVTASDRNGELDVARMYEEGRQLIRNIEYIPVAGWSFYCPGKMIRNRSPFGYGGSYIAEEEPWYEAPNNVKNLCCNIIEKRDVEKILEIYPDFRFMVGKFLMQYSTIFHDLKLWMKNRLYFETLVNIGAADIARDGRFYRLKDKMMVIRFLSRNPEWRTRSFGALMLHINKGATIDQYKLFINTGRHNHLSYDEWKYTCDKGVDAREMSDYLKMCKRLKKDMKDSYWHFPKDFSKAHYKVIKECRNLEEAERAARLAMQRERQIAEENERMKKYADFSRMMKKWERKTKTTGGLRVYIPQCVDDVIHHADFLSQCLITSDYISDVVSRKCILAFVCLKDGTPLATAELIIKGRKYELGQFYGDESKSNYMATREQKKALEQWAKKYNIRLCA